MYVYTSPVQSSLLQQHLQHRHYPLAANNDEDESHPNVDVDDLEDNGANLYRLSHHNNGPKSSMDDDDDESGGEDRALLDRMRKQVEFYFSAENLSRDLFLQALLNRREHPGLVPIATIASFPRIQSMYATAVAAEAAGTLMTGATKKTNRFGSSEQLLDQASSLLSHQALSPITLVGASLRNSTVVQVSEDGQWLRRRPQKPQQHYQQQFQSRDTDWTAQMALSPLDCVERSPTALSYPVPTTLIAGTTATKSFQYGSRNAKRPPTAGIVSNDDQSGREDAAQDASVMTTVTCSTPSVSPTSFDCSTDFSITQKSSSTSHVSLPPSSSAHVHVDDTVPAGVTSTTSIAASSAGGDASYTVSSNSHLRRNHAQKNLRTTNQMKNKRQNKKMVATLQEGVPTTVTTPSRLSNHNSITHMNNNDNNEASKINHSAFEINDSPFYFDPPPTPTQSMPQHLNSWMPVMYPQPSAPYPTYPQYTSFSQIPIGYAVPASKGASSGSAEPMMMMMMVPPCPQGYVVSYDDNILTSSHPSNKSYPPVPVLNTTAQHEFVALESPPPLQPLSQPYLHPSQFHSVPMAMAASSSAPTLLHPPMYHPWHMVSAMPQTHLPNSEGEEPSINAPSIGIEGISNKGGGNMIQDNHGHCHALPVVMTPALQPDTSETIATRRNPVSSIPIMDYTIPMYVSSESMPLPAAAQYHHVMQNHPPMMLSIPPPPHHQLQHVSSFRNNRGAGSAPSKHKINPQQETTNSRKNTSHHTTHRPPKSVSNHHNLSFQPRFHLKSSGNRPSSEPAIEAPPQVERVTASPTLAFAEMSKSVSSSDVISVASRHEERGGAHRAPYRKQEKGYARVNGGGDSGGGYRRQGGMHRPKYNAKSTIEVKKEEASFSLEEHFPVLSGGGGGPGNGSGSGASVKQSPSDSSPRPLVPYAAALMNRTPSKDRIQPTVSSDVLTREMNELSMND